MRNTLNIIYGLTLRKPPRQALQHTIKVPPTAQMRTPLPLRLALRVSLTVILQTEPVEDVSREVPFPDTGSASDRITADVLGECVGVVVADPVGPVVVGGVAAVVVVRSVCDGPGVGAWVHDAEVDFGVFGLGCAEHSVWAVSGRYSRMEKEVKHTTLNHLGTEC